MPTADELLEQAGFERRGVIMEQIPTPCRWVLYRLTAKDAEQVNRRRTTAHSIAERMKLEVPTVSTGSLNSPSTVYGWPQGAQAHIGNHVAEGDSLPMLMVVVHGTAADSRVNGQVHLDGNDTLWVTSVQVGIEPGTYQWPARV